MTLTRLFKLSVISFVASVASINIRSVLKCPSLLCNCYCIFRAWFVLRYTHSLKVRKVNSASIQGAKEMS